MHPAISSIRMSFPIVVGLLLLYAGLYKAIKPAEAVLAVRSLEISLRLAEVSVSAVTVAEIYIGTLLVFGISYRWAIGTSLCCFLGFTLFLWYLATLANPPTCGCPDLLGLFTSNRQKAVFGLIRNIIIMGLLLWSLPGGSLALQRKLRLSFPKLCAANPG
jgi:hypothetical protein